MFRKYGFDIEKLKESEYRLVDDEFMETSHILYALDTDVQSFLRVMYPNSNYKIKLLSEMQHFKFNFEDPDKGGKVTPALIDQELAFIKQFINEREKEFVDEALRSERQNSSESSESLDLRRRL